jgi:hypothetical protein
MRRPASALFALVLAGCSEPARSDAPTEAASDPAEVAPAPDVAAAATAFYEPYTRAFATGDPADWDRPIFSADLRRLIERWKTGFSEDEVGELQDFAWLCECQDWDHTTFKATVEPDATPAGTTAVVDVDLNIGWGEKREAQLHLVLEDGAWRIDDIRSVSFPQGLRAELATAMGRNAETAS